MLLNKAACKRISVNGNCNPAFNYMIHVAKLCNDQEYTIKPSDLPSEVGEFLV